MIQIESTVVPVALSEQVYRNRCPDRLATDHYWPISVKMQVIGVRRSPAADARQQTAAANPEQTCLPGGTAAASERTMGSLRRKNESKPN